MKIDLSKLEKIWNVLNTPVSDLFKKQYLYKFFTRKDLGRGVYEAKKYDKKTGKEIPYEYPVLLQTVSTELLLN